MRAPDSVILGVIAARGGSKGLPGKNLRPLAGVPLIVHTIRAAQKSKFLSDFVVSTDDPRIAEVAQAHGAKVPFPRPVELASDGISPWPAARHAAEKWEGSTEDVVEAAVLLQPTSPLRTEGDIDNCIARFRELEADICATAVRSHDSPYFNMMELTSESAPFVQPCSALMRDHLRRQDAAPVYSLNGAVFVIKRCVLASLENHFCVERFAILQMPRSRSIDIDCEEDLELAEWLLSQGKSSLADISL